MFKCDYITIRYLLLKIEHHNIIFIPTLQFTLSASRNVVPSIFVNIV